jgi:hypothetical protein
MNTGTPESLPKEREMAGATGTALAERELECSDRLVKSVAEAANKT